MIEFKKKKMITNVTGLIDINYQRVRTISVCGWGWGRKARDDGFHSRRGRGIKK